MSTTSPQRSGYDVQRRSLTATAKTGIILAAIVLFAVLWLFFSNRNDINDAAGIDWTDDEIAAVASSGGATSGLPTASVQTAAGTDVLQAANGNQLASLIGQSVSATGVHVNSVVADEGFWVGNASNQLFVHLSTTARGNGESAPQVLPDQNVTFTGAVTATPSSVSALGVTSAEGATQLTTQGAYVDATSFSVQR